MLVTHDDLGYEPIHSSIGSPLSPLLDPGYVIASGGVPWVLAKGVVTF